MYDIDIHKGGLVYALSGYKSSSVDTLCYNTIYSSLDSGYSWKVFRLPFNDSPKKIEIYDKDTIFACFEHNII